MLRQSVVVVVLSCALACKPSPSPAAREGATRLKPGSPLDREIKVAQTDRFEVELAAGQVLFGTIDQRGVDVVVTLDAPDGKTIAEIDSPNGFKGPEPVLIEAKSAGLYEIIVKAGPDDPFENGKTSGHYQARIDEIISSEQYADRLAAAKYESPRLLELFRQLHAQKPSAIESFWAELKDKAPLVEPSSADANDVLITFAWRADAETKYVGLMGSGPPGVENRLEQFEGTDLWYLTARMPKDSRFTYAFAPAKAAPAYRVPFPVKPEHYSPGTLDPLNPHRFLGLSAVELPGAPPQPWALKDERVPQGRVITEKIASTALGEDRRIGVYTPAGYDPKGGPYPFVIVFDGEVYGLDAEPRVPTPRILDNLIAAKKIPPTIAALVAGQGTRNRDLTASPKFVDFLANELVPMLRSKYHASTDPAQATVAGSSYGGTCAAYAGLLRSDIFGNVLSQSGGFEFFPDETNVDETYLTERGWLIREFAAAPKLPLRFFLEVGRYDRPYPIDRLGANRWFRDVLRLKGYPVTYSEFNGGHDYLCWRGTLADGLIALSAPK